MPLNKVKGNMYPWCSHTWNPIRGKCPHDCSYCYMKRFPVGELRFEEKEMNTNLGEDNTIFVGSSCDMWAEEIKTEWIVKILNHMEKYPKNTYLLQSKNLSRFLSFPFYGNVILGTTIETNGITEEISDAPLCAERFLMMEQLSLLNNRTMISIEPILDFDLNVLIQWIRAISPEFVSIGADSKGHNLPEPPAWKVKKLIEELKQFTEVRIKDNLKRITEG